MSDRAKRRAERDIAKLRKKWDREDKIAKAKRKLGKLPMQYKRIPVPDWDAKTHMLSTFRMAYADFFRVSNYPENSALQNHSTQMFWHRLYLQKQRMKRMGIILNMESERVQRSDIPTESITETTEFDGRYLVNSVNEAIYSKRSFIKNGQEIGVFHDHDSINYSILTAKQQGPNVIVCPNCGNPSNRENLIDGCDYCGTKFSVEDLSFRICGFDYQIEVAKEGLADEAREARMSFDREAGAMVRAFDPNFSMQSFTTNIYNKMAAIHFADDFKQISAFSEGDLSGLMTLYKDIVNIDFSSLYLWDNSSLVRAGLKEKNSYYVEDGMQHIDCTVSMVLFGLVNGTVQLKNENVKLHLEKSAECKTQNVCGPSVFRCKGCGSSISLMDGKSCHYCGREIDMKKYDWVITRYESKMSQYGTSLREFN